MSIQTVEIALPTGIDSVSVGLAEPISIVEVRQGPAGEAGSAVINAATQSDGTADLDLLNVETVTATVTDTLTAPHIHGNLAGSVYAHIRAGEALDKGDPVYVSGSFGSGSTLIPIVSKADASNAAKMPAIGIMDEDVANNATGHMVITGTITELDTAGLTVNAELYVAAGGGMTATPPTARAQPVARVERANANNGAVIVKVNGLSASDATGNTLVRRTSGGGASLNGLTLSGTGGSPFTSTLTGGVNFANRTLVLPDVSGTLVTAETLANSATITASTAVAVDTIVLRDGAGQINITNSNVAGTTAYASTAGWTYAGSAASAHRTALGLGTGDSPTFAGLNAVGNGVTTTTLGADGRQSWFLNNSGVAAGQISYSTPNAEPGILIIKGTGRSDIRAVAGMGIAIASYSSGSGAPAEQFRFSLAGNMLVGTTSETGLTSGGLRTLGNAIIGGTLAIGNGAGSADLILVRDGASGTLAQRNGNAAQESRIYGTYTGAGDYRRLALKMSSAGVAQIVAEGAGTGAAGNRIEIDGLRIGKGGGDVASNTALGASALNANTTGSNNSAVGNLALLSNTTGNFNAAVGSDALRFNSTGNHNSAVGYYSLRNNTTGGGNSAVGFSALPSNTTGSNNSAVGYEALANNTTGNLNTAVGFRAGRNIANGTTSNAITANSVYLGSFTKALASNQTNQIVIGYDATGLGSNTAVLGNDSIETTALKGNVGIGTTSPASKLTVTGGDIEVTDSASGIILKSPNGTRYRVTISDLGVLSTASL